MHFGFSWFFSFVYAKYESMQNFKDYIQAKINSLKVILGKVNIMEVWHGPKNNAASK